MAKTTKPTKQQIAQAKARAGGNNPVKVTNAGLKKLGNAALMAASFTPVGRVAKVASAVSKLGKAKKVTRVLAEPKSGIRVKTAARKPAPTSVLARKPSSSISAVKKVARKTAPKTGLETRGTKPTKIERINRARDLQWDKAERSYDAGNEMRYTGLVSSNKGMVAARGAGKKNMRKRDAIRREANKNLPIQIKSDRSFTSPTSGNMFRGTDSLKANNARGLRAANKPTNKVGSKADKELRSRTKSVTFSKEETATLNDYYYGEPDMVQVMSRRTPVNEARSVNKFRPTPKKKTAAQLRPKKK